MEGLQGALAAIQGAGGAVANSAIEFRAGKCKYQGTTVRPDPRKGLVRVQASSEDQLMHLTWTSRVNGVVEDDRIIFPGEAAFSYVEQARNNPTNSRVFLLKFAGSSERLFFWMQDPDASKDEDVIKRVNARLNAEEEAPAAGAASLGGMDQQQLLAMLTGAAGGEAAGGAGGDEEEGSLPDLVEAEKQEGEPDTSPAAAPAATAAPAADSTSAAAAPEPPAQSAPAPAAAAALAAGGAANPVISSQNLASILANLGGGGGAAGGGNAMAAAQQEAMKGAGLLDVADAKGVIEGLDAIPEGTRQALMSELPEGDRTEGGMREVIRSPQFQQAVGQLDHVLQSGQGRELLMSMGIAPPQGFDNMGPAAVRAFLNGLQKKSDEDNMKD